MKYLIILFALFVLTVKSSAQIYYWVDENGTKHYSTTPPQNNEKVTDMQVQSFTSQSSEDSGSPADKEKMDIPDQKDPANRKIQIYTNSTCSRCDKAKEWLRKAGYTYTEYNIDNNNEYLNKFQSYGGGELPLIIIDNDRMQGWQGVMKMVAMLGIKTSS